MVPYKSILKSVIAFTVLILLILAGWSYLKTQNELDTAIDLLNQSRNTISEANLLLSEQKKVIDDIRARNDGLSLKLKTIDSLNFAVMQKLDHEVKNAESGLSQLKSVLNQTDELQLPE